MRDNKNNKAIDENNLKANENNLKSIDEGISLKIQDIAILIQKLIEDASEDKQKKFLLYKFLYAIQGSALDLLGYTDQYYEGGSSNVN